jgi:hypothetical protein
MSIDDSRVTWREILNQIQNMPNEELDKFANVFDADKGECLVIPLLKNPKMNQGAYFLICDSGYCSEDINPYDFL